MLFPILVDFAFVFNYLLFGRLIKFLDFKGTVIEFVERTDDFLLAAAWTLLPQPVAKLLNLSSAVFEKYSINSLSGMSTINILSFNYDVDSFSPSARA